MAELQVRVFEKQRLVYSAHCSGTVELGRQDVDEEGPYRTYQKGNICRVVIARLKEQEVSRHHVLVEPLPAGRARLTNLRRLAVRFEDGGQLEGESSREIALPIVLAIGNRQIGIDAAETTPPTVARPTPRDIRLVEGDQATPLQTLVRATSPPGTVLSPGRPRLDGPPAAHDVEDDTMFRWLQSAVDVLQSAASSSEFFDKAAAALVELVGLDTGQVLLFQDGTWRLQAHQAAGPARGHERQASRHVLDRILAEKRTFWQVPGALAPLGSLLGVKAVVAAPILDRGGAVLGVLYGDRECGSGAMLTKLDGLLVELLASGVAAGMARIEHDHAKLQRQKKIMLYERELQIARNIQAGFLPEALPRPADWEIVGHFQPAREVAGDFYDCFPLSAHYVALVMADVCDKGVGAALFMALFRSLIRAFCVQTGLNVLMGISTEAAEHHSTPSILPASRRRASLFGDLITLLTVEHTNKYVTSNHASACMFASLFIGMLDTMTGELSYVNAGHDAPTIVGPNGIKTRLEPTGPVVGLRSDALFDLSKVCLAPGDILLAHTDGVMDARNAAGAPFSEKRFLAMLQEGAPSAAALIERLVAALRVHIGGADQFDDITLLAARWALPAPSALAPASQPL